jgi:transaldolase
MTHSTSSDHEARLWRLSGEFGQSPWLDNLQRSALDDGSLEGWRDRGIRGLTSNPTIFNKSISGSDAYDAQFAELVTNGIGVTDAYWELVITDIHRACDVFGPVHADTGGLDGFVSVEVDPGLAHDTAATESAARALHERIRRDNLMVKIPATREGLGPIRTMVSEGRSINVTLIFSLDRYREVVEAYLSGLEHYAADPAADLSIVSSVASFFVSRVDTAVDDLLSHADRRDHRDLMGTAALTQARLAYTIFNEVFSGPRWESLQRRGARPQRLLWASTGTKNPAYPDTCYIDGLIGPHTVNTAPESTLEAFADHGNPGRTLDLDPDRDADLWARLSEAGISMDDVAANLERDGVAAFRDSFDDLVRSLSAKAEALRR